MRRSAFLLYISGVLLLSYQPLRFLVGPLLAGDPLFFGTDESHYLVRIQEALLHPFSDPSNGVISGPDAPQGGQPAGLEWISGILSSKTDLPAPLIALVVSLLLAPLVLPFGFSLARRCGASARMAVLSSVLFFFLFLGPLKRFVHQSWSLPLTMLAFLSLLRFWQEPRIVTAILAGVALGVLPFMYFWSWTFLWGTAGVLFFLSFFPSFGFQKSGRRNFILLFGIALLIAFPAFFSVFSLLQHPLAEAVALRSSLVLSHELESWPRSLLLAAFAALTFATLRPSPKRDKAPFVHGRVDQMSGLQQTSNVQRKTAPCREALVPLFAAALALLFLMNQQLLHGRILSFSTHYYPYVCLVALLLCSAVVVQWSKRHVPILFLSSLFLLAAARDYGGRATVFQPPRDAIFSTKFLTEPIALLREPPQETVLTDLEAALLVATYTDDHVVFTEHLRHVLIPTREYAERYCLSEALTTGEIDAEWVPRVLSELVAPGEEWRGRFYAENQKITREACEWVQENLSEALRKYGVTVLLWNERARPQWVIDETLFYPVQRGEGWSLWQLR